MPRLYRVLSWSHLGHFCEEQLLERIDKSLSQIEEGKVQSSEEVEEELLKGLK